MKKLCSMIISVILALETALTLLPGTAYASVTSTINEANADIQKVQSYAEQLKEANYNIGRTTGTYTWDTESKNYSWTYFNGLMIDAFNMLYRSDNISYTEKYYDANIGSDGSIVNFAASDSVYDSKINAGSGALDSVEPMRAIFDIFASSDNKAKYKAGIQTVYIMLENQTYYPDCGGNYKHNESSSDGWYILLDGIYMAEPFLMECAKAIDEGNLTLMDKGGNSVRSSDIYTAVYNRFVWVYENMYDSNTGLYYHAYNPSTGKTNGVFLSRSIGWYAMALVDTIDLMPEGDMKTALAGELTRLFDGLLRWQDYDTGMWYNVPDAGSSLSGNILETSGTSMFAYAMMKAYNNGWVTGRKYASSALKAFNGVVGEKMKQTDDGAYSVEGTYEKSWVGTTKAYYTTQAYTVDEAKGVGALIMASVQAKECVAKLAANTPADQMDTADARLSIAADTSVDYRTRVTVRATAENISDDNYLVISINGTEARGTDTEVSYYLGELKENITYTVKVVDAEGNIQQDQYGINLCRDGHISCNSGLLKKLIAFFRGLLGILPEKTISA